MSKIKVVEAKSFQDDLRNLESYIINNYDELSI